MPMRRSRPTRSRASAGLQGHDVFFLTGTDEHGIKMLQTARGAGHHPARACRPQHAEVPRHGRGTQCSNDDFIRTARRAPFPRVPGDVAAHGGGGRHLSRQLCRLVLGARRGLLRRERAEGSADGAKLSPQGTPVEWVEEESYFFRLSTYQDKLLAHYDAHPDFIGPTRAANEVKSFVRRRARRICRSRAPPSTGAFRCRAIRGTSCMCGSTR